VFISILRLCNAATARTDWSIPSPRQRPHVNALSQTSGNVIVVTSPTIAIPHTRGKNKQAAWRMPEGQPMATIVLSLDTCDPHARKRLEALYFTMFNLRGALQRVGGTWHLRRAHRSQ
jgi:hypothetical protein